MNEYDRLCVEVEQNIEGKLKVVYDAMLKHQADRSNFDKPDSAVYEFFRKGVSQEIVKQASNLAFVDVVQPAGVCAICGNPIYMKRTGLSTVPEVYRTCECVDEPKKGKLLNFKKKDD